jgi:hypothetical protein
MNRATEPGYDNGPPESRENLWALTFGPVIWAIHFLLSYVTAAVWCAKVAGGNGGLGAARTAVGVYTALALLGIFLIALRGYRRHRYGGSGALPRSRDSAADRHRFLGFTTLLLCGLSFVATLYVAFAVVFIGNCR